MAETAESEFVLEVANLSKRFGSFFAVNNLSFSVKRGEVFGFLGPNGAGKTTSISMICGLLKPDSGDVFINGQSVRDHRSKAKQLIGLCPQNITVWETLTCLEQLVFMGRMYDLDGGRSKKRSLELLGALGLYEKRNKLARTLSGGMQRRLNIALALVHEPELVVLDEPQAGLDPQSRVLVRDYIRSLSGKVSVILTTHDMDEAERLSDRVAIIDRGEMLVLDSPDHLKKSIGEGEVIEIQAAGNQDKSIHEALDLFPSSILKKSYKDGIICVASDEPFETIPEVLRVLKSLSIKAEDIKVRKKTLEDVFITLTGRGLRE